jgi:hypothetical protein
VGVCVVLPVCVVGLCVVGLCVVVLCVVVLCVVVLHVVVLCVVADTPSLPECADAAGQRPGAQQVQAGAGRCRQVQAGAGSVGEVGVVGCTCWLGLCWGAL